MKIEPAPHRKFPRILFNHRQVNLEFTNDSYHNCQIENLCLAGMFVLGDFGQHEDKHCTVDVIQSGPSTELSLQAVAKVVRKVDEGIALEFTSMTWDSYLFLQVSLRNEKDENSLLLWNLLNENFPFAITDDLSVLPETNHIQTMPSP